MTDPTVRAKTMRKKAGVIIYFGYCCREWALAWSVPVGSCGLCGERPKFLRWGTEDEQ